MNKKSLIYCYKSFKMRLLFVILLQDALICLNLSVSLSSLHADVFYNFYLATIRALSVIT